MFNMVLLIMPMENARGVGPGKGVALTALGTSKPRRIIARRQARAAGDVAEES